VFTSGLLTEILIHVKISLGQKVGVWINIFENFKMLRFGEALVASV
jgi:hypothetical protein